MTEIIDIHPHIISPDTARYPLAPLGGTQSNWSSEHPISADGLVAAMDEAGIAKAVVVQASTAYGFDNSCLADAVAAHPDRLTGVFSVDVLAPDAVERIRAWQARGLVGMRLFTTGSTMPTQADWLDDPASYPAWAHAEAEGLPVCLQMRPEGIPKVRRLLDRFPNAIVVLDHLARSPLEDGPPYAAAQPLWDLASYPGVNLKLTLRNIEWAGDGRSTVEAFLDHMISVYGMDRVAWGSNFPAAEQPLTEIVARARDALAHLPAAKQEAILGGTARRLYPVLDRMPAAAAA